MTVGPGRLLTGSTRAVIDWIARDIKRTPGRPPARSEFFTKALIERNVGPRVLERGRSTGPLWLATGANGDVTEARSRKLMINKTTSDIKTEISAINAVEEIRNLPRNPPVSSQNECTYKTDDQLPISSQREL
uniref:H15 domain-containing protein n=1 Tax=Haemonchus contortus TaxID=6289 RepID=A0A7I4YWL4_HAECO